MNKESFEFDEELDTKEGRHFIYKAVNFFVVRSIEKAKKSPFKLIEKEHAKKLFEKYKFIKNKPRKILHLQCKILIGFYYF